MRTMVLLLLLCSIASAQTCDPKVRDHVYRQDRLKIVARCISVTGVIVDATAGKRKDGQRHEKDADNHGWLKLDENLRHILLPGNEEAEGGNLVFECVCQYGKPKQRDAVASCKDYKSGIVIPPVGTRVQIWGDLVEDLQHKPVHRELHPVYAIKSIPTESSEVLRWKAAIAEAN